MITRWDEVRRGGGPIVIGVTVVLAATLLAYAVRSRLGHRARPGSAASRSGGRPEGERSP
ncbi:hypothetical protein ACQP1V_20795 [Microtetraspora malaysiensis]|uniref:hypothetical protein n=1 Tax=Microtetraspora malaysiensis TaxID=161358 RepID=UPI003D8A344C